MKILIFSILICAVLGGTVFGQRKPSVKRQNVVIEKWGVKSFALPDYLLKDYDNVDSHKNPKSNVTTTSIHQTWVKRQSKNGKNQMEITLSITNWDSELSKVTELKPEIATPEMLLTIDLTASLRDKAKPDGLVEKADYYKIDGVNGTLTQAKWNPEKQTVFLAWQTYRIFNNLPQIISFSFTGFRRDIPVAQNIIDSLKLQK